MVRKRVRFIKKMKKCLNRKSGFGFDEFEPFRMIATQVFDLFFAFFGHTTEQDKTDSDGKGHVSP